MKISNLNWTVGEGWSGSFPQEFLDDAQLVFIFGSRASICDQKIYSKLRESFPNATFAGCSTAGEIFNDSQVMEDSLVVTAIIFEHSQVEYFALSSGDSEKSYELGAELVAGLRKEGLIHAFVLSDGLTVNGSQLVEGIMSELPNGVTLTGGLAGDGTDFNETLICGNEEFAAGKVVILGFYGDRLKVGFGSLGGFVPFGPERRVTKSKGNVLYQLDDHSALDLYKKYLGPEKSENLAYNQFLFPLSYRTEGMKKEVVRTILSINEEEKTMTFAGDIPEGSLARLMKTNGFRLVEGAQNAASMANEMFPQNSMQLAILVSCVGRKIVMTQRIDEEIEAVREVVGEAPIVTGFYSYGEIAHFQQFERCEFHNQTMTITAFSEI